MSFIENQLKREYNVGDAIFKDGDAGDSMFILLDGEVEISKVIGGNDMLLATLQKGSIFGEMAIINRRPRSATAIAKVPCIALQISREMFNNRLEEVPRWMQAFFSIMGERLREATENQSVRTPEGEAKQFIMLMAMLAKQIEPDNMDRITMPWKSTVATVALLMDDDESTVNDLTNKLVTAKLGKSDKGEVGRVLILDLPKNLYDFADYTKAKHLLDKGHIDEMPEEYHLGKQHAEKVIDTVNTVMESQGALDDFTKELLGKNFQEKYGKPLVYFKDAIDGLIGEGVMTTFKGDGGEEAYRINDRELFSQKLNKLKAIQKFTELKKHLTE